MVAPRVFVAFLSLVALVCLVCADAHGETLDVTSDFTTNLDVATSGTYEFTLSPQGNSSLFIGDQLVIASGQTTGSIPLASGSYLLRVEYEDCCGGIQQLVLPAGVTQSVAVPEPSTLLLLGAGLAVLAVAARMRTGGSEPAVDRGRVSSDRAA